ncbi:MAG: hypothetical protein NTU81_03620 [Candidatus Nomurabacteria bacterium]|nr:hypothetical protein [Candidatus Nomurabacteria bacterium]
MEKLPQKVHENKDLAVHLVRHAKALYIQNEWDDIETANDIGSPEGKKHELDKIKATAEKIASLVEKGEEIAIWASPTGRTLETAKTLSLELKNFGVEIRDAKNSYGVNIFDQIGEVKNFSHEIFMKFVNGGTIKMEGNDIFLEKKYTNPDNLPPNIYFQQDAIHNIDKKYKDSLPNILQEGVGNIEKFYEVTNRIQSVLKRLNNLHDKKYRIIIVTHDALTSYLVNEFTSGDKQGIDPAEMVSLLRENGTLKVWSITSND